jgi:hypothetical protein
MKNGLLVKDNAPQTWKERLLMRQELEDMQSIGRIFLDRGD